MFRVYAGRIRQFEDIDALMGFLHAIAAGQSPNPDDYSEDVGAAEDLASLSAADVTSLIRGMEEEES